MEITGKGIHHSLDTTGNLTAIQNAIDCLRPGGVCGILGATPPGAALSLPVSPFMSSSKTLRGIVEGDVVPEVFIPQMIALYQQGRFPFDKLIRFYTLEEINQALEDSEKGVTVKPVIRMPA
jgi:aryl-alcohol dehydrogenase